MTFYCSTHGCARRWANFRRARAKSARCPKCRQPATPLRRVRAGTSVYVLPDFPEHYNMSMGCVVKNREHHRQIQNARGLQDWEPCRNSPGSQLSMGRKR